MLHGNTIAEQTYNYLIDIGCTPAGACGVMGNLAQESGKDINPDILQISFQKKFGKTSMQYRQDVDLGIYTAEQFEKDGAGWGICQFTYHTLKAGLLAYCINHGRSIADLECQLDYMMSVITKDCRNLWKVITTTDSVREASNRMLFDFERPSDQGKGQQDKRCAYGEEFYKKYATPTPAKGGNSPLVDCTYISPNKTSPRQDKIKKITIHHMAGNLSAEDCGRLFSSPVRQGSSNYGISSTGKVGLYVAESDRAWTSGDGSNDHQAITIEVANCKGAPNWEVSDKAYSKLIDLCVDICKRNGIKRLTWTGDKNGTLTCHYMFQATACPGPYLKSKMPEIAEAVNKRL